MRIRNKSILFIFLILVIIKTSISFAFETNNSLNLNYLKTIFKDENKNSLIDNLDIEFLLNSNETFNSSIYYIIEDKYNSTILYDSFSKEIQKGENNLTINLKSNIFRNENLYFPIKISLISFTNQTNFLNSFLDIEIISKNYSHVNFEKKVPDLILNNITYNQTSGYCLLNISNLNPISTTSFIIGFLNQNSTLIKTFLQPYFLSNSSISLGIELEKNLSEFTTILDYYNNIEEEHKYNNFLFWPINKTKKEEFFQNQEIQTLNFTKTNSTNTTQKTNSYSHTHHSSRKTKLKSNKNNINSSSKINKSISKIKNKTKFPINQNSTVIKQNNSINTKLQHLNLNKNQTMNNSQINLLNNKTKSNSKKITNQNYKTSLSSNNQIRSKNETLKVISSISLATISFLSWLLIA